MPALFFYYIYLPDSRSSKNSKTTLNSSCLIRHRSMQLMLKWYTLKIVKIIIAFNGVNANYLCISLRWKSSSLTMADERSISTFYCLFASAFVHVFDHQPAFHYLFHFQLLMKLLVYVSTSSIWKLMVICFTSKYLQGFILKWHH